MYYITQSEAIMQSAQCRRVQGPLSRSALQGLLEHIQLALCHCEPPHGFDNHGLSPHPAGLLVLPCDALRVVWRRVPGSN